MKYIKTYENGRVFEWVRVGDINYDKFYTLRYPNLIYIVGKLKLIIDYYDDKNWKIEGYVIYTNMESRPLHSNTFDSDRSYEISLWDWNFIFESTPEEIEQYELLNNANKYNL